MTETQQSTTLSAEQYRAFQRPTVILPTAEQLLDLQVARLVAEGWAKPNDADPFRKKLTSGMFLFVPRRPANIDWNELLTHVKHNGKEGYSYLDPQYLVDEIEIPDGPYLMTDVEDGYARRNIEPSVSLDFIFAQKRSPYVTFEGVVHGVALREVFETHYMDFLGSRYWSDNFPRLYLVDDHLRLHAASLGGHPAPGFGAPSCRSRIIGV